MESNDPGNHRPASTNIPPQSSGRCLFMEQVNPPSGLGLELGWRSQEHVPNPHQLPQPQLQPQPQLHPFSFASTPSFNIQEAIQREIEKSRIREELIVQELMKRRMLESEVRRELMMERELALRQGANALSFGVPSVMGFDSSIRHPTMGSIAEKAFQGEGNVLSKSEGMSLNGPGESDWCNDLPFQRVSTNLMRVSEVKSVSEGGKEKEIILLSKPDEISGSKRKCGTPPLGADASVQSDEISRKRAKEEWSCAICKVSATSEQALKEHLEGKKHKAKESKLKAKVLGKNHSIGMSLTKSVESIQVQGSVGNTGDASDVSVLPQEASEKVSGTDNQTLVSKVSGSEGLIKNHVAPKQKSDGQKKKYKFWCGMCRVGAYTETVMASHKKGKKHLGRLQKCSRADAARTAQSNQSDQILNHEGGSDNNLNTASVKAGEGSLDKPWAMKVDETTIEDCAVMISAKPNASNEEPSVC